MEKEKKKSKCLIFLIVILSLLVLGLSGYILYDKVLSNKEIPTNEVINNVPSDNNVIEEKLPEWVEYLLKQDIKSISYQSGRTNDNFECESPKSMTKEQLKKVLEKMTAAKLKKYDMGGAGGQCWQGITVKYGSNSLNIFMGKYLSVDELDSNILELLEKEDYINEKSTMPTPWWVFEYNWDTSYIDSLFE